MKVLIAKKFIFTFILSLFISAFAYSAELQKDWWNIAYPSAFDNSSLKPQAFIKVDGNRLVDAKGSAFLFKGMNVAAPDKLVADNQWNKALFEELKDWGVNVIRLPIHPIGWRATGEQDYLALIDEAVVWANDLDIYLIIDWHSIGYLPDGLFQHPMYETTEQETLKFWQTIAKRYVGVSTIAVYEIFNEPTDIGGKAGTADWKEWKAFNEKVIDVIYAHDRNVIPLVAGFNWAYDLRPVMTDPIERPGIAYVSHPYPQKEQVPDGNKETFFKLWDQAWGDVAKTHPIIATELGWVNADGYGAHIPVINDGSYGPMIIEYMNERNISWVAWCFDPDWSPTMIKNWDFEPTQQGAFFKQALR
ncbi:glycoside hydrolase family 5 protein [Glaciecola sp. MH2013]|uniref:glycoside hydrolase family 5 protein n=1 Tax=Glaciecola sp. MH2013 TaxID=2785524 RepID=UPI00189F73BA|nr:glycoside hydrolase family 5 protein [Glaciecola sp. MH2013]MBF7073856.1 glycoside hydrolase family 5 protein [Glaciecola sp. MH2013]